VAPPNGQLVPITITGTITDVGSGVAPDTAVFAVMDAYGSPQPRDHITLGKDGSYTCTLHLQASRKGNDTNGRQYTIRPYRGASTIRVKFQVAPLNVLKLVKLSDYSHVDFRSGFSTVFQGVL
jgi:hypothetical protein